MRWRRLWIVPAVCFCIGLTVSAQTLSGEDENKGTAQTAVTAYVSADSAEVPGNTNSGPENLDAERGSVATGDYTEHVASLLLACFGALVVTAAAAVKK